MYGYHRDLHGLTPFFPSRRFSDLYVSYNRGYKSGGFNLLDVGALNRPTGHVSPSYNPEIVDAYEVGLKSDLFDRRLRLNVAAFYYDYKDIDRKSTRLNSSH